MTIRTCLLVTDDPDDHIEFSEALYEISSDTVLLAVTDPGKALTLVALKRLIPDYIIVDLGMSDFSADVFFDSLDEDPGLENIPLIAYGEFSDLEKVKTGRISAFLNNDSSYSGLRSLLVKIFKP